MTDLAAASGDESAEVLAAEALLEHGGLEWQQGALQSSDAQRARVLVEAVLRDDPNNVMANHLCIHLYDLATDRTPARLCAERLDAMAFPPEAEHLAHMPAHYWIETGDYAAAVRSSERAYQMHPQHYAKHDIAVGYSAAMMLGSYATARQWSERMSAVFGSSFSALTALRFGRYDVAFADGSNEFAAASVRGIAALHAGRVADADAIALQVRKENLTQGYLPQIFLAELAEAHGNPTEAEDWLAKARASQRAAFSGEMIPLIPADEVLGSLRLRRGDVAGAIAAFADALDRYPNDPRARFGLAQALAADGNSAQAASAQLERFENEWKGADTNVRDALP
jgi:Tfp pilus assembly protein PilF